MLKALEARKALKSPVRKRLSMKVPERQQAQLAAIAESTGLKKTDVLRAVFGFIEEDIVQERSPELLRQMQEFSVLAAGCSGSAACPSAAGRGLGAFRNSSASQSAISARMAS